MAFPAQKPEAGKAKNSWPCSTSNSNKNVKKQFFYKLYFYLFIIMTIRNIFFLQDQYQKFLGKEKI